MDRDELINIVESKVPFASRFVVIKVIEVAEPLIRADEREKVNVSWQVDFDTEIADLRAKVQVIYDESTYAMHADAYYKVLALIDGAANE